MNLSKSRGKISTQLFRLALSVIKEPRDSFSIFCPF